MTIIKSLFLSAAVLSLTACQTTSAVKSPDAILLSGLDKPVVAQTGLEAGSVPRLSASSPTCSKFYQNVATFVDMPVSAKSGPSFGGQLMKTVVLASLAGVASGGVAAMGIKSSFAEAALVGTASQVTYNAGGKVYDKIVSPDANVPQTPNMNNPSPLVDIEKAAATLGCPAPDAAAIAALRP